MTRRAATPDITRDTPIIWERYPITPDTITVLGNAVKETSPLDPNQLVTNRHQLELRQGSCAVSALEKV